ncbi:Protein SprT {ECO:0000255/HAMAP-Rule:MF_00746} [Pantoea ananatis]|nr:Protein SprT {ECO:0000255/HAMAP-Rule:MF_00746} [Pantoea ananatis]
MSARRVRRVRLFCRTDIAVELSSTPLPLMLSAMKTSRLPIALQQAVMRALRSGLERANEKLEQHYPEPRLVYQQRGTAAGTAWLEKWEIRLNPVLLMENQQAFIDEVIPHELAHLLVWKTFGRVAPHGKEWKWMMETVLGVPARRTHQFEVESVRSRTFAYRCQCQQHQLTVRRHNRVVRGESEYRCVHCGSLLKAEVFPLS